MLIFFVDNTRTINYKELVSICVRMYNNYYTQSAKIKRTYVTMQKHGFDCEVFLALLVMPNWYEETKQISHRLGLGSYASNKTHNGKKAALLLVLPLQ